MFINYSLGLLNWIGKVLMKINKICFLAGLYPTNKNPKAGVFYQNLINEFAKMGIECRVIHPVPINNTKRTYDLVRADYIDDEHFVTVYRPKTVTFGAKRIGFWNTAYTTACFYAYSAERLLYEINWKPDIFYGHFISPAGIMAARLSRKTGIPAFIAYGESEPWSIYTIGIKKTQKELQDITGFISVSSKNKNDLINFGIADKNKIRIFPNAVDREKFYKMDRKKVREELGFDEKAFIVAFTGHFINRKGSLRLAEAMNDIGNVYAIFIGEGEEEPFGSSILFKGSLPHDEICKYLNAADIFVLPTLAEGSCNAIIEAMACGLPIISSDKEFNYDILNSENALLIDPVNVIEIRDSIIRLMKSEERRKELSEKSLQVSRQLSLKERASSILKWMESMC